MMLGRLVAGASVALNLLFSITEEEFGTFVPPWIKL